MSGNQAPHPVGVVPPPPPVTAPPAGQQVASPSASDDIAAFLAEGHSAHDDADPVDAAAAEPAEDDEGSEELEDADDSDEDSEEAEESDEDPEDEDEDEPEEKPKAKKKFEPDPKALAEAVKKQDLPALLKAMGPAAAEMLTSKAHITLRMQAKELAKKELEAKATETRAADLSTKLGEKYGDPIAARKAAADGDADAFVELVEKWGGYEWNAMVKWVANTAAGRKERLAEKGKETEKVAKEATAKQTQALAETKSWIETGLSKVDAKLVKACPEVVDLCLDVLRSERAAGIDTPKKAFPAVVKRLREQHARLSKYFGQAPVKKVKRGTPASARVGREQAEPESTEPMSVAELIQSHVRAHGGSRRRGV